MELLMIIFQPADSRRYKKLTGKELNGVKELAALAESDKAVARSLY